jgi:spore coat polysaccharide biosynthesis protein SpsF (cytidylyltransferase family)
MTISRRLVAVVLARMSSQRLPGKVMTDLLGSPMLGHLLDRLELCDGIDGLIVATSDSPSDDQVAAYTAGRGVACYRGDLNDVAARMIGAADAMKADALVRVSGDSPLLDPALVTAAVAAFRNQSLDLVTNVQLRTFPKGQSVEVISLSALRSAWSNGMTAEEREHVTKYFYERPEAFSILNLTHEPAHGDVQLSVDTLEDLNRVKALLGRLGEPYRQHHLADILRVLEAISPETKCNA